MKRTSKLKKLPIEDQKHIFELCEQFTYSKVCQILAQPRGQDGGLGVQTNPPALSRFYSHFGWLAGDTQLLQQFGDTLKERPSECLLEAVTTRVGEKLFRELNKDEIPILKLTAPLRTYHSLKRLGFQERAWHRRNRIIGGRPKPATPTTPHDRVADLDDMEFLDRPVTDPYPTPAPSSGSEPIFPGEATPDGELTTGGEPCPGDEISSPDNSPNPPHAECSPAPAPATPTTPATPAADLTATIETTAPASQSADTTPDTVPTAPSSEAATTEKPVPSDPDQSRNIAQQPAKNPCNFTNFTKLQSHAQTPSSQPESPGSSASQPSPSPATCHVPPVPVPDPVAATANDLFNLLDPTIETDEFTAQAMKDLLAEAAEFGNFKPDQLQLIAQEINHFARNLPLQSQPAPSPSSGASS